MGWAEIVIHLIAAVAVYTERDKLRWWRTLFNPPGQWGEFWATPGLWHRGDKPG